METARVTYRAATVHDLETVAGLRWEMETERDDRRQRQSREAFVADYFEDTRDAIAQGTHRVWLAEVDGVAIACVLLVWWAMPPHIGEAHRKRGFVSSVYTRPAYRRQGISRALMTLLIDEARALRVHRLVLWASAMGQPLYDSLGFIPCRGMELNLELA